jgi:pyruvate,water dikinase
MKYIKFFKDISLDEIPLVGGKNAALGQMIQDLGNQITIPHGFAVTVQGYHYLLQQAGITFDGSAQQMRNAINKAAFPDDLTQEITDAYRALSQEYRQENLSVAVRSSATTEDLPNASFAGQQESFLHIQGVPELLDAIKKCMASLFTDRAVAYRKDMGFSEQDIGISVGIQKMVNSDDAVSGVMFTLETESGHKDFVTINAAYGLGETIVGGTVNPDEFMVHKPKLLEGFLPLVKKKCGDKQVKAQFNSKTNQVELAPVSPQAQNLFSLTEPQIFELAHCGIIIENYFSSRNNQWTPMDIEWAQDGIDKKLYIVQARPETVHARQKISQLSLYHLQATEQKPILGGLSIGRKIASGAVKIITAIEQSGDFKQGDILVTQMTDPDWVPLMKLAAAIITDRGGRTCHAAIVARELGVPALVGTDLATRVLKVDQLVTVDCSKGTEGFVYEGSIPFTTSKLELADKKLAVKLLVNIANPDNACEVSLLPIDGAGLVRLEFIIAQRIGVHPMAIMFPEKVHDAVFIEKMKQESARWGSLQDFYVSVLSADVALIAAALYPRPVVVRLTDFKSNEYKDLLGGSVFEPHEENPMLGFRGASRYCDPLYAPAFELECRALKKVREVMGFDTMIIMVPFVRTIAEAQATLKKLAENGLERGKNGLKIYLMVEIPANVILLELFAEYFDGFSIGSNDLTQLTLGVDRDSGLLRHLFDENDLAVKALIAQAITKAHSAEKAISICGQAPSDFPEFAHWLIEQKIDALSLNADAILPFIGSYK